MGSELHSHDLGELAYASFRRRICELIGDGHHGAGGGHVDDRAVDALFHHVVRHGAAQQERAPQVDRQDAIEVFRRDVEDRARRDDAGVVEEDVALAEALDAVREKSLTVGLLAHVHVDGEGVRAGIPGNGLRARGTLLREDIAHDHLSAVLGEGAGTRRTDATGRTRDDGGFSG